MLFSLCGAAFAGSSTSSVKVGVAKADITGPITDISTGYNSLGDLMEGLLTRLYARAFVIDNGKTPLVYVSAELVHMTESIKPGVLTALKNDGYTCFSEENVMISATHCHSSTSNTSWFALYDLINGVPGYDDESYRVIVKGIKNAIEQAYDSRVKGSVSLVYGDTGIEASNRSADAYLTNVNVGDYGYKVNADGSFSYKTGLKAAKNAYNHEMAGIVFTDSKGNDIGFLNFFGSHGTSNGIDNVYVASDHKGYAALKLEQTMGEGFIAAFAQADSGDTSPNKVQDSDYHEAFLRPNELSDTTDAIENQIVHGKQEAKAALDLIKNAKRTALTGTFDYNYTAVDFSDISVDLSYVGDFHMPYDDLSDGKVNTCEPCIGAGIIAGDEEGAPVDNAAEGAVKHNFVWNEKTKSYDRIACDFKMIDLYGLQYLFEPFWPLAMKILQSDEYDEAQAEKVVCLAVGKLMQPEQPLQIIRLGSLAIAGVPFELTYEQANRTRAVLEKTLASAGVKKVIISTHTNAYSQYVTTREEFAAQHYEGATCLFGPWSGAALTQELDKLAQGIVTGVKADKGANLMQKTPFALLYTTTAIGSPSVDKNYGGIVTDVDKAIYSGGQWVKAEFQGVEPRNVSILTLKDSELVDGYSYMEVQKLINGKWYTYLTDTDPYTTFHYESSGLISKTNTATVGWLIKDGVCTSGTYRLVYNGIAKIKETADKASALCLGDYGYEKFSVASSEFQVAVDNNAVKANPFTDIESSDYFYEPILWAYYHEPYRITAGTKVDTFSPDNNCTRANFVTFLWRAAGEPEPTRTENPFDDVDEGSYYFKAVLWAYENGITRGVTANEFMPDDEITRDQVVAFMWRFEGSPAPESSTLSFKDVAKNSPYREAIIWATEQGITVGYDDETFGSGDICTRGQAMTFLYRLLG